MTFFYSKKPPSHQGTEATVLPPSFICMSPSRPHQVRRFSSLIPWRCTGRYRTRPTSLLFSLSGSKMHFTEKTLSSFSPYRGLCFRFIQLLFSSLPKLFILSFINRIYDTNKAIIARSHTDVNAGQRSRPSISSFAFLTKESISRSSGYRITHPGERITFRPSVSFSVLYI